MRVEIEWFVVPALRFHASHYLKMVLDAIFGPVQFGNEIIWKRHSSKGLASTRFARNHDVILRYTKSNKWIWNPPYTKHDQSNVEKFIIRRTQWPKIPLTDLTNPAKIRPNLTYEFWV